MFSAASDQDEPAANGAVEGLPVTAAEEGDPMVAPAAASEVPTGSGSSGFEVVPGILMKDVDPNAPVVPGTVVTNLRLPIPSKTGDMTQIPGSSPVVVETPGSLVMPSIPSMSPPVDEQTPAVIPAETPESSGEAPVPEASKA